MLREDIDHDAMFEEIVGTSAALRRILSLVEQVAASDTTVLITGETGTGKNCSHAQSTGARFVRNVHSSK